MVFAVVHLHYHLLSILEGEERRHRNTKKERERYNGKTMKRNIKKERTRRERIREKVGGRVRTLMYSPIIAEKAPHTGQTAAPPPPSPFPFPYSTRGVEGGHMMTGAEEEEPDG